MNVVLDSNIFVSASMIHNGKPAQILQQIQKFTLFISNDILQEIERVLSYPRIRNRHGLTDTQIHSFVKDIERASTLITVTTQVQIVKADPDDNKFLSCAIDAHADYLISGDPHLTTLKKQGTIRIVKPAEFLQILNAT